MLDAPVSRGVAGADRGTLAVMVRSDAQAFATCKPLLLHIDANVFRVGDCGSGSVVKLVNTMLALVNAAVYEGMLLGVKAGVDLQMIYDIVQASSGTSSAMQAFPNKIFAGDFTPDFMIDLAHKALRLALELGDKLSVPLLMGSVCINGRGGTTCAAFCARWRNISTWPCGCHSTPRNRRTQRSHITGDAAWTG
jgi:3-hydroxyisobutyrate dehydrogenase-like beta-hydroxyacid dehydrogenase